MLKMARSGPLDASLALKQVNGAALRVCCMYHVDTMPVYYVEFSSVSGSQNKCAIGVCMNWVATLRSPHQPWYAQGQQQ